jgi:hypothetical protein
MQPLGLRTENFSSLPAGCGARGPFPRPVCAARWESLEAGAGLPPLRPPPARGRACGPALEPRQEAMGHALAYGLARGSSTSEVRGAWYLAEPPGDKLLHVRGSAVELTGP